MCREPSPISAKGMSVSNPVYEEAIGALGDLAIEVFQTDMVKDVSDYQSAGDDAPKGNNSPPTKDVEP